MLQYCAQIILLGNDMNIQNENNQTVAKGPQVNKPITLNRTVVQTMLAYLPKKDQERFLSHNIDGIRIYLHKLLKIINAEIPLEAEDACKKLYDLLSQQVIQRAIYNLTGKILTPCAEDLYLLNLEILQTELPIIEQKFSSMRLRIKSLIIGINTLNGKMPSQDELCFLNALYTIPGYRLNAIMGMLPSLTLNNIQAIINELTLYPAASNGTEMKAIWMCLLEFPVKIDLNVLFMHLSSERYSERYSYNNARQMETCKLAAEAL